MSKINLETVINAIEEEPELPGQMPDEMWDTIQHFCRTGDRDGMEELLTATVRTTKEGIKERVRKRHSEQSDESDEDVVTEDGGYKMEKKKGN
jgi:hypothetical protein